MKTINVRMPEDVHEKLRAYKKEEKSYMSLNSIIVEAIDEKVRKEKSAEDTV